MSRVLFACLLTLFSLKALAADNKLISGGIGLNDNYVSQQLFQSPDKLNISGWLSLNLTKSCSVELLGSKSLLQEEKREIDVGAKCQFSFTDILSLEIGRERYFLNDDQEVEQSTVSFSWNKLDLTIVEREYRDRGQGQSLHLRYELYTSKSMTVKTVFVQQHGVGFSEQHVFVSETQYRWSDNISFGSRLWLPINQNEQGEPVSLVFGFTLKF